jgi:Lon-like ATP-dependent protease
MTNLTSSFKEKLDFRSYKSSEEIEVPERIIDQIIGQKEAVETVIKAAKQRRNVLLIGEPGIGKSMLAKGMAELLPPEELQDILVYPNMEDNNNPFIGVMPAGEGKTVVNTYRVKAKSQEEKKNMFMMVIIGAILVVGFYLKQYLAAIIAAGIVLLVIMQMKPKSNVMVPKLLVNNERKNTAPFIDATGAHAGALLGDVRHDPYQSGGLGTPAHERVEAGMIHKSNKGVLYVDEIGTMQMKTQQELLTAMQEKKYSITGQSESSSGAMVRSDEVPCDFVLVASGNLHVLKGMHIALRSRIRGYGYEVFMKDSMKDTMENRDKLFQFIAQEVKKDGRIPHFSREAVEEIIHEAQRRAGKKDELTLKLRDLGGLVRAAGDIAKGEGADSVTLAHVITGKKLARTLEQQIADRYIDQRKTYSVFKSEGRKVGIVNGLAIIGDRSGILLPIAAEAAPAQSKDEGKIIATGKLGEIAKEAVQNVSALIKKNTGTDISNHDIHIQFLQSYEGIEGDSASVSIATAVISALENVPVDQSVALTGSLSVRGDVMPVGGVTGKIEAAAEAGMKKVIIPESNMDDVLLEERYRDKIQIIPARNMSDVLENALIGNGKDGLVTKMKKITNIVPKDINPKPPKPTIN